MANRRYGNAGSVSSLISSARSAYEREQAYQDQIEQINWDMSAKTAEEADKYIKYLDSRAKTYEQSDPMKFNTIRQKAVSANRSYVSAESSRYSMQVLEGNMSNTQKYQQIRSLYQQAADSGDMNLAQRLYGTLDRLSVTIQKEQEAAASAAVAAGAKAYSAYKKTTDKELKYIDDGIKALTRQKERGEITDKEFYQGIKTKQPDGSMKAVGGYADLIALKEKKIGEAAADPSFKEEDRYYYEQKQAEFQTSPEYKQATAAGLNASRYMNGVDPQYAEYDKNGNIQYKDKTKVAALPGLNNVYTIPNLADAGNLDNNATNRKAILFKAGLSGDKQGVALPTFLSTDNDALKAFGKFYYAQDPVSGELYYVNKDGYATTKLDLNKPEEIAKNSAAMVSEQGKGKGFWGGVSNVLKGIAGTNSAKMKAIEQAGKETRIRRQIESLGYDDINQRVSGLGQPASGAFGGYYSARERQLQDALAEAQQRKAISEAAQRAQAGYAGLPKAVPTLPQSITPQNTVVNTIGPRLPTPQLKKDAAVIGSPQFVDKYNLGKAYKRFI